MTKRPLKEKATYSSHLLSASCQPQFCPNTEAAPKRWHAETVIFREVLEPCEYT